MRSAFFAAATVAVLSLFAESPTIAQGPSEADVRQFFNGQRMLVTYREGGAVYGTFFTLDVQFCRSGRCVTVGESRKHTVLDNGQVSRFTDEGTWEVTTIGGQMVLKYVSVSGQPNVVAISVSPDGRISLGEGVSIVRRGAAQCPPG